MTDKQQAKAVLKRWEDITGTMDMRVIDISEDILKVKAHTVYNVISNLRSTSEYLRPNSITRMLGWVEVLEKKLVGRPNPVRKSYTKGEHDLVRLDWHEASNNQLVQAISDSDIWDRDSNKAIANEIQRRLKSSPSKSLSGFVVDVHQPDQNLSTSMVGEDGYDIPCGTNDHLMLTRTEWGFKLYIVKPSVEDPRLRLLKEQNNQEMESLRSKLHTVEMENSELHMWRETMQKALGGIMSAPANGKKEHELVATHSD